MADVRVNESIRSSEVRLVAQDGSQVGIKSLTEALQYARDRDLDLVEVAPQAAPPVCRIMDYGKYRYELEQKAKKSRKHQSSVIIKEMKLRPKIDEHDYQTKKKHIVRFLKAASRVKVTIMFRGREMAHTEIGHQILDRLAEELRELANVESAPKLDGRNMIMLLNPTAKPVRAEPAKETV